jgi:hypothetical protein
MGVALEGPDGSKWYTAEEAAAVLGIEHQSIHKIVERGQLVPRPFANISVFNSRDLEAFILRRRRVGRPKAAATKASTGCPRRAS